MPLRPRAAGGGRHVQTVATSRLRGLRPFGAASPASTSGVLPAGQHPANAKAVKTVRKYDVIGDAWIPCASLRKARDHLGLVGYQGRLHALGGWSGNGSEPKNRASCETCTSRVRTRLAYRAPPLADAAIGARRRRLSERHVLCAGRMGGAQQGFLASAEILQAEPPPPISPGSSLASPRSPISRSLSIGARSSSGAVKVEDGAGAKRGGSSSRGDGNGSASGSASGSGAASSSHSPQQGIASLSQVPVPPSFSPHGAALPGGRRFGPASLPHRRQRDEPDAEAGAGAQPTSSVERLDMEEVEKWIGGWHRAHDPPHWEAGIARMLAEIPARARGGKRQDLCVRRPEGRRERATASVEVYDPAKDEWQEVRPMNKPRFSAFGRRARRQNLCAPRAPGATCQHTRMRMHSCCLTRFGSLSRSPSLSLSLSLVHTDVVGGFAQGQMAELL